MQNQAILDRLTTINREDAKNIQGTLKGFIDNKREWKPFPITHKNEDVLTKAMGIHKCLQKCIALAIALELPVGLLTSDGSKVVNENLGPVFDYMSLALLDNAKDEENHYSAFQEAAIAYDVPHQFSDEAWQFREQVLALDEHPVLLAGFMELTVFFPSLAMLRRWGNPTLKNMTAYVSRDESCHVNTNFYIVDQLGLQYNYFESVNEIRQKMIQWLTSDLKNVKELTAHWEQASTNLAKSRKAPELADTKAGMVVAFFETPNY